MTEDAFSVIVDTLLESHYDHLAKSAISPEIMQSRHYETVLGKQRLKDLGFKTAQQRIPGILIPLYSVRGDVFSYQYRPDKPRLNKRERPIKYENIPGQGIRPDIPPACQRMLGNPTVPIWFTEGSKKADALASCGQCAVSLNGVWGYKGQNEFGASVFLADFDYIALKDRAAYLAFDSDAKSNLNVHKALTRFRAHLKSRGAVVKIIDLPDGLEGGKMGVDDCIYEGYSVDDLLGLAIDAYTEGEQEPMAVHTSMYMVHEGQFCLIKSLGGAKVLSPLCNFTAQIDEEIIRDNGLMQDRLFKISGTLWNGRPLEVIDMSADLFDAMGWVSGKWGAKALVSPGLAAKDHLRYLIKKSMNGYDPRYIFTHTGWRDIDGKMVYLSGSGAVGRKDIEVDLKGPLARYALPLDYANYDRADMVHTSLNFLDIGNPSVMMPLFAAMYLAPLCEILYPAFTLWLQGASGSFKSVLTALALCHFGDFDYLSLPSSWRNTGNRLEYESFVLKDMPLVIDDWHPAPNPALQKEMEAKADHVIRGQGNRAGRGRLMSDASPKDSYFPRGLIISSGEQIPSGQSQVSRIFVVDAERDDIDLGDLTVAQHSAWAYKFAMAYYVEWVAANWDHLKETLQEQFEGNRERAIKAGSHLRLPGAVAWLYTALEVFLQFCIDCKIMQESERAERLDIYWGLLTGLSIRHGDTIDSERAAYKFIEIFTSLLDQRKIILISILDLEPKDIRPGQAFVGWWDERYIYLNPKAAYAAVYEAANRGGESFTFKPSAVWADMARTGMIDGLAHRSTIAKRMGTGPDSAVKRVIQVKRSVLMVTDEEEYIPHDS